MQCEVCSEVQHKYKCPRCLKKTCSLACVKLHKTKDQCNGKRDKCVFVGLKAFKDANLRNDYTFLEDVCRKADTALKDKVQKSRSRPKFVNKFFSQAKARGIKLRVLPFPLSKRANNSSMYDFRKKHINWLTEWNFTDADSTYKQKFHEDTVLDEALSHFLHPTLSDAVIRFQLKQYVQSEKEDIKVFMKVEERNANDPKYYEMDMKSSITANLKGKVVVEYPTFLVVPKRKWHEYPVITQDPVNPDEINIEDIELPAPTPIYPDGFRPPMMEEDGSVSEDSSSLKGEAICDSEKDKSEQTISMKNSSDNSSLSESDVGKNVLIHMDNVMEVTEKT